MDRYDIMNAIEMLSMSQGFYGRLFDSLKELEECDCEKYDEVMSELEAQNFSDPVDMVMFLEC